MLVMLYWISIANTRKPTLFLSYMLQRFTNLEIIRIHIYSQDTDVLVLAVSTQPELGSEAEMIMDPGENRRKIQLQPIYNALGCRKVRALRGFHGISGCDTTCCFFGKSKTAWWKAYYLEASGDVIKALTNLGVGESPNWNVLSGCEKLICQLFRTKACSHTQAGELRWQQFKAMKGIQGIKKLSPTQDAIHEHIRRAHLQCIVWQQVLVAHQSIPDSNTRMESGTQWWTQTAAVNVTPSSRICSAICQV